MINLFISKICNELGHIKSSIKVLINYLAMMIHFKYALSALATMMSSWRFEFTVFIGLRIERSGEKKNNNEF